MSAKYTFTYFDLKARGEIARLLFALAGVEYKENIVTPGRPPAAPSKEWLDLKPKTMFGGLPLLEVDGKVISQSHAIERFLAREFGFAGKTSLEQAQVDQYISVMDDIVQPLTGLLFEQDATKKKKYTTETLPKYLRVFEKHLTTNGSGFLVGKAFTLADVAIVGLNEWLKSVLGADETAKAYKSTPNVAQLIKRVREMPKLAKYLQNRTPTPF